MSVDYNEAIPTKTHYGGNVRPRDRINIVEVFGGELTPWCVIAEEVVVQSTEANTAAGVKISILCDIQVCDVWVNVFVSTTNIVVCFQ